MKILYLSDDNRCRSILAEAITRHVSEGMVEAFSAGVSPNKNVYPAVYSFLRSRDISTLELQTKRIDEVGEQDMDIIVFLSEKLSYKDLAGRFKDSVTLEIPIADLSHSDNSDDALHNYFEFIVDSIEFRLRKAFRESCSAATQEHGRTLVDRKLFMRVFSDIEDDDIATKTLDT